ncbi:SDR family NAD(P)-dependent oxidoreductase [Thalassomonas sp. M1454]|uniref:SDR family NAD(P)-dependent oxidoreductase n=1 Tax=Thalassomonas sp. M1454 TaxID=2594477 RepID=UPI00117F85E5|nr:SDR family NAD(P)-dependent oxidoreductase [Thalassomonas sp. M1454]TRX54994.1 SDR family NAD(P)-dependent oxidoreductase [Thalassomonas sp. M1454]
MSKILITGATSGIGEALVHKYLKQGHNVIACGRNTEKLAQLTNHANSSQLSTLAFDITNTDDTEQAIAQVEQVDIIILNAGDCQYIDDAIGFDNKLFQHIINTNLIAIGHLLHFLLPKVSKHGQVVLVSSSVTIVPLPRAEAYGASKAGLDYLANSLRIDLAKNNIGVTLVHPGFVATPLTDKNTFDMPFKITSEDAAKRIYAGVAARKSYLHFPKRFTYLLKLIAMLPNPLWQRLVARSIR